MREGETFRMQTGKVTIYFKLLERALDGKGGFSLGLVV
jgi:hypothetical protein